MEKMLFLFLILFVGCSVSNSGENKIERTYPVAYNFKTSTVQKIKNESVVPPDSLNVHAYVKAVIVCPKNASCILPDGIIISDSLNAETNISKLQLTVQEPRQFKSDSLYQFSLAIGSYPGNGAKRFELLGYNRLLK